MQTTQASLLLRTVVERAVGHTAGSSKKQISSLPRLMSSTTNDAGSDWSPVFHHPANELKAPKCGGVISPSQLEDSDRDENRKKTAEREERWKERWGWGCRDKIYRLPWTTHFLIHLIGLMGNCVHH